MGELLRLRIEPTNTHDDFAVAVVKNGTVVGHVPKCVSRVISYFLKKDSSSGLCEVHVTGSRVNRGVGLGLEIPCKYKFYGRQAYVERLQSLLPYANVTFSC